MESRKLAVSGKIKHYVVDNDNVVTPLIHNNRDIVTFTGNSRFKHRSRGYFESPMNDIPNFNIGKQATLDKHGYRDPKLIKRDSLRNRLYLNLLVNQALNQWKILP